MMKIALIDIGSNTMRMVIYNVDPKRKKYKALLTKKNVAGLASYFDNKGNLSDRGIDKLLKVLTSFQEIIEHFGIKTSLIFATASIRNAKNAEDVQKKVEDQIGRPIDLISGTKEAELGYLGIRDDYDISSGIIIDIGGGSSEISIIKDKELAFSTSLKEGSLSLYKKYVSRLFPTHSEVLKMQESVKKLIESEIESSCIIHTIYGSGGTMRAAGNIAMEHFDLSSNQTLELHQIDQLIHEYQFVSDQLLKTTLQVSPSRIHTLTPGFIIASEIAKYFKAKNFYISQKGVREGYLSNYLSKQDRLK